MSRKVFYSFNYKVDNWRAATVRNVGIVEGNPVASDNKWEEVTKGGDDAIKKWIDDNMLGRSCVVVLIGSQTANRKWINYEIDSAWKSGKGVVGVCIHGLKNSNSQQDVKGQNPFDYLYQGGRKMSSIVSTHDTPYHSSLYIYDFIKENLSDWIEDAIKIRSRY